MKNIKYLQKLFFLFFMGVSLSFVCACGDDEDSIEEPDKEQTTPDTDEDYQPNDSIPSVDDPVLPNDSIPSVDEPVLPKDSIPSIDEPVIPDDNIPNGENVFVNGYEAVDLGLSVRWATCNVGASSPEEYGGYYAWGETEEKKDYNWYTYKWCKSSYNTITKYCTNSSYGTVDNKIFLESEDDVAYVKLGANWRMPTFDEIKELIEKCSWKWITYKKVNGQLVTGPNGNSIFIPASGYRYISKFYERGTSCMIWTVSLREEHDDNSVRILKFYSDKSLGWSFENRDYGLTVRPVTE